MIRMDATILVIEDSPVVQHLLRATLMPMGVGLLFADDGETGLELARRHRPDVVTLDIGLPGIDGWTVLSGIRSDSTITHMGVIVLTAHAQKSMEIAAADRGADGFLTKPFRPADLRNAIGLLLDRHPAQLATG
jgi:DNA-binding response OmpR family regulator